MFGCNAENSTAFKVIFAQTAASTGPRTPPRTPPGNPPGTRGNTRKPADLPLNFGRNLLRYRSGAGAHAEPRKAKRLRITRRNSSFNRRSCSFGEIADVGIRQTARKNTSTHFRSTVYMFIMRRREGRRRLPGDDAAGGELETSSGRRLRSLPGKRTRPAGGKRTAE